MEKRDLLKKNREHILRLAQRHGAQNIRLFGSVARDEADENSDIDLLVDMAPGRSLLGNFSITPVIAW